VQDAVRVAVEALFDAADDDSATGGPDRLRHIYPIVASVSEAGYVRVPDEEVAAAAAGAAQAQQQQEEVPAR
jgi:proteasome beta subunit